MPRKLITLRLDPRSPVSLASTVVILLDLLAVYFDERGRGDIAADVLGCARMIVRGFHDVHTY